MEIVEEGLADYDRLAILEDTYSKAHMKSKGTKDCSNFLKLNLAVQTSPSNSKTSTGYHS